MLRILRKTLLLVGLMAFSSLLKAQQIRSFSSDPLVFIAEFETFISRAEDRALNKDFGVDLATDLQADIKLSQGLVKLSAHTSFIAPEKQSLKILGDQSSIEFTAGQAFTSWKESSALRIGEHTEVFPPVDAYQIMIESFSSRISSGNDWVLPIQESLDVAQVLDIAKTF